MWAITRDFANAFLTSIISVPMYRPRPPPHLSNIPYSSANSGSARLRDADDDAKDWTW